MSGSFELLGSSVLEDLRSFARNVDDGLNPNPLVSRMIDLLDRDTEQANFNAVTVLRMYVVLMEDDIVERLIQDFMNMNSEFYYDTINHNLSFVSVCYTHTLAASFVYGD